MSENDLWRLDATDSARLIRTGAISSRQIVEDTLARLDTINPRYNPIALKLADEALASADKADEALRAGNVMGPLHGVPVTTKVNTDQAGCPTDDGVLAFRDSIAVRDSPVIGNLKKAGAIVVGRTNAPAFSMRWFTDNDLHGRTISPWNANRTPGGSSGGAVVALALGVGALAHGNDIAGSIRYPAYCTGVYGLRPSFGRIPAFNHTSSGPVAFARQLLAVHGPLARTARDLRLGFKVMAQSSREDPRTFDAPVGAPRMPPTRVAVCTHPGGGDTHPAVVQAIKRAGDWLEQAGYQVEEAEPPQFRETADIWPEIAMPDVIAQLEPHIAKFGDASAKKAVGLWRDCWPQRDPATFMAALATRYRLLQQWMAFFEIWPVLLMPCSRQPPFKWDEDVQDRETTARIIDAQGPLVAVSALGLPAVAAPTGLFEGVPIGVQIVGAPHSEDLCLDVAEVIEARAPKMTPIEAMENAP